MINYQIISSRGKPRFAVVDYQIFLKLLENSEGSIDKIKRTTTKRNGKDPTAKELTKIMRNSPIRGWRLFRRMTQADLAELTGLKQTHISMMEANKIKPRKNTLAKIAEALSCEADDLVTQKFRNLVR